MLDEALKIKDAAQQIDALKKVLDAAKAANDVEGQAECETDLGGASKGMDAIAWYEAAIADFAGSGNKKGQGGALKSVGNTYFALGSYQKSIRNYDRAIAVAREIRDRDLEARALFNISSAYTNLGHSQKSLEYLISALPIMRKLGDTKLLSITLFKAGNAFYNLGQTQQALDHFTQALSIYRQADDKFMLAATLTNTGNALGKLGQTEQAVDYLTEALALYRAANDKLRVGRTLYNIGTAYQDFHQFQKALAYFNQAIPIERDAKDWDMLSRTLLNEESIYSFLGENDKVLENLNQALAVAKEDGDRHRQAVILGEIGNNHRTLGHYQKALQYYDQALPIFRELGDKWNEATELNNLAVAYDGLGQHKKALEYLDQALHIRRETGARRNEAATLGNIGDTYRLLGQNQRALGYLTQAIAIAREVGDPELSARCCERVATCLTAEMRPALAIMFAKQSVNAYQDLRKEIQTLPKPDQDSYAKKVEPTYRHLADLLIKQGRLREAEKVMNLLKDEENFEFVARDASVAGGVEGRIETIGAEGGWWDRYEHLQDKALKIDSEQFELSQKASKLRTSSTLGSGQKSRLAHLDLRLKELDAQKDVIDKAADAYFDEVGKQASALGDSIRREAEERVRQTGDELPTLLRRLHKDSGEKIGAVYALASTDELDFLIVTYAGRAHVSVPVKSEDLNAMISEFRKGLTNPSADPRPAGEKLYHLVFERLIRQLNEAGCTRVVWCLDGTLRYVPIGALWDGKQYLIERGDFTMFDPLNLDRVASDASKNLRAAGFAATQGKGDTFAPLPGADRELKNVVKDESQSGFTGAVPGRA